MDLLQKVYDREYEEVLEYLLAEKDKRLLSRQEMYTMRLINSLRVARRGHDIRYTSEYNCNESDYFRRVFEGLKQQDYVNVKKYLELTIGRADDKEEFQTYLYIIDDILDQAEKNNAKKEIKMLDIHFKKILDEVKEANYEQYDQLQALLFRRRILEEENGFVTWYTDVMLNLIDTTMLVKEQGLSKIHFENISNNPNIEDRVIESLTYDDYPEAYRILNKIDYRTELPNLDYYYLLALKKLLVIFTRQLNAYEIEVNKRKNLLNEQAESIITYLFFTECECNYDKLKELLKDIDKVTYIINELVKEEKQKVYRKED